MSNPNPADRNRELLAQWKQEILVCHKAHFRAAALMQQRNRGFGIPVIILSAVAGTTVFGTLESSPELWVKILVGFLSVAAAVLARLQTFLKYGELAEKHNTASLKYGALQREVEEMEAKADMPGDYVSSVRTRWTAIDSESPSISPKLFDKIETGILTPHS
jgi:SMODS and SLOG-associating 2TM effector domain family 4